MSTGELEKLSSEVYARQLDKADELANFRERFFIPPGNIYMDGNSLGLLSRDAEETLLKMLAEWKQLGIDGWTKGTPPWFSLSEELSNNLAPLWEQSRRKLLLPDPPLVICIILWPVFTGLQGNVSRF